MSPGRHPPLASHPEYQQQHGSAKIIQHIIKPRAQSSVLVPATITLVAVIAGFLATAQPSWIIAVLGIAIASRWRVLYQTLTPLPNLGIQLSTARGLDLFGCEVEFAHSNKFLPLGNISTVVIHEGLVRWGVRYYLAIVGNGVDVAFEDVNPAPEVLEEVYHCVREVLFDEYASEEEGEAEPVVA